MYFSQQKVYKMDQVNIYDPILQKQIIPENKLFIVVSYKSPD